jgi:hypothetical protein
MNNENLEFLHDNLKYLGFGDNTLLNQQLEEQILKESKEIELYTEAYFDDFCRLEAKLYFRRSDQKEMYFFNKYEALLRYPDDPDKNRSQTFYINKGMGVTFKEAFNLLQGRAVNKDLVNIEGEKYNAWVQLNFEEKDLHSNYKVKQYRAQYRYELEKVLENYPIRELQNEETKAVLIRSLRRGNLQLVTFVKVSKTEKMFIEANPMFKTINIFPLAIRAARKSGGTGRMAVNEDLVEQVADPLREETPEEDPDPVAEVLTSGYTEENSRTKPDRDESMLSKASNRKGNRK